MLINLLVVVVLLPLAAGLLGLLNQHLSKWLALLTAAATIYLSGLIIFAGEIQFALFDHSPLGIIFSFRAYLFNAYLLLAVTIASFLIILYSFKYMAGQSRLAEYYGYILMTLGAGTGTLLAADLLSLAVFWGFSGFTLYMLAGISEKDNTAAAKKAFLILGGTDALLLLGIGLVFAISRSFNFQNIHILPNNPVAIGAYLLLLSAALAKAGAFPFHTWIPSVAQAAPATFMAYLPAALDKLIGIYFIYRLTLELFIVTPNSFVSWFLLTLGSLTLIGAVMLALVQHNLKKLLAYHAVSQVGYMIIGIGTGIPLGIAGGLFHMLNNVIYKTCLFLCGGAVEYRTKTSELKNLGGLVSAMPITFMVTLIAAFSISGVPPFNGFVSKWMIYQGIVESNHPCWVVWITVAMFGSALTMASFTKLMYAMFFSESTAKRKGMKEVPVVMWLPGVFLAACCIIFGVAAFPLPLQSFIFKIMPVASFCGAWNPTLATAMLLTGLALGILFYLAGNLTTIRQVPPFLGGEKIDAKISGEEFYATIKQAGPLSGIYRAVENKTFDIYDQGSNLTFGINALLKWLHRGLLHTYLAWGLVGLIIIIYVLSK